MSASAILKLQSVGFSREQVEALADFMDTQAASKVDLLAVKGELKTDIFATEAKLNKAIADAKIDTIKWVIGMGLAQVGLVFAVLKLFVH